VPFAVLSGSNLIPGDGWKEVPPYEPEWWRITAADVAFTATTARSKKDIEVVKGLDLFEQVRAQEVKPSPDWIDALFDSPIYQEQLKLAVRGAPRREMMLSLLTTIEARGGSMMKPALAQMLGVPLHRWPGQNVSRILNVVTRFC
jgi:hypothetical protein